MDSVEQLAQDLNIPKVEKKDYWFVRTESGSYFDDFYEHGYVAIGWDYLTLESMSKDENGEISVETLKQQISQNQGENIEPLTEDQIANIDEEELKKIKKQISSSKRKVTSILNKVYSFIYNIKQNDIIVVPSENSDHVAIGVVTSDVFNDTNYLSFFQERYPFVEYAPCPYFKRRYVKWYTKIEKNNLDIFLQNALKPQQAITSLNEYADFINRSIFDIYTDGEKVHSIFRTFQKGSLTLSQLHNFTDAMMLQLDCINKEQEDIGINPDDVDIKLNIHSPGIIEFICNSPGAIFLITTFIGGYIIHKHGGKISVKAGKFEFSAETKGEEGNTIENRRLDILDKCLGNPDYNNKMDELKSLNMKMPEIFEITDTSTEEGNENLEEEQDTTPNEEEE